MTRLPPGWVLLCSCGCVRGTHKHYSHGHFCGRCKGCQRWRPRLRRARLGLLTPEDLRLLSQPVI